MSQGKLEVVLVSAKGLEGSDFLSTVDPYCTLTCRTQEHKSSVVSGDGSPEWNETFIFNISGSVSELYIKLYDKDNFSDDDFLGEAKIPLEPVFYEGNLQTTSYNMVKDEQYKGEVRVSLTFTPERYHHDREIPVDEFGGWKQSSMD